MTKLETERLIIDSLSIEDKIDYFNNIAHDKKVLETFMCQYEENLDEFNFERYLHIDNLFAIRLKESNKLIGIILICEQHGDSVEIGYGIGFSYWNLGYGTEATKVFIDYCFNSRGYSKVYASFFKGNIASKRVMEKCGMKYDHETQKELTYLGIERDLIYYSISKER